MRGPVPQDEDSGLVGVFERVTDAFVALDASGRYTYVNRKAAEAGRWRPLS